MKYLVDTDTASFFIRGIPEVVASAMRELDYWCISSITCLELSSGLFQTQNKGVELAITEFLRDVRVAEFTGHDASEAGRLLAKLKAAGTPIGHFDTLIAAHALSLNLTLVTNNTRHFSKVRDLRLANWLTSAAPNPAT
jgi:tRNA(fMet)-specific endonuclease VapC